MSQSPPKDKTEFDSQADTQPVHRRPETNPQPVDPRYEPPAADPLATYQPIRIPRKRSKRPSFQGCGCAAGILLGLILVFALYLLFPGHTRLLLLGIDSREEESAVSRTDTIMIIQVNPLKPDIHMLSIPRDLWVSIPGVGENRINTAHFFAEANQPGSGPAAVIDTIEANFGVRAQYYARVRFAGFREIIDAMGGLDIDLQEATAGLDAGRHHLNGEQALAFARDRKQGDDFSRMKQGQIVVIAAANRLLNPLVWPRTPMILSAFFKAVDTNLPVCEWPRLVFALARAGTKGVDQRTLTREMTTPFTTDGGAQVLGPNWDLIRPLVAEMFAP